jgi:hypothetical protein
MADTDHGDRGFLGRWSERKLRAAREPEPNAEASGPDSAMPSKPTREEPKAVLTDADMPPLDRLDGHSDYSAFFSEGVSESLRRKALSKLFHSPHLNVTDGLDDYAEDFTTFTPLGDLMTADLRHRLEATAGRLLDGYRDGVPAEGQEPADRSEPDVASATEDAAPPPKAPPVKEAEG